MISITIILTWLHPNLIAPLFNNFTELKKDDLRARIFALAQKNDISLGNILVMHSSMRSAHSNAYLYGIGSSKTIVISDSLFTSLT